MAAVDYFLKLDGIQGESKADKHTDEIDVLSFSWGATQSGTFAGGGGGGAGKVAMQDFHFTMLHSKASPALMLACAQGDHIKSAILTWQRAAGVFENHHERLHCLIVSNRRLSGRECYSDGPGLAQLREN